MAKRIANQLVDEETGEVLAAEVVVAPLFWKTPYNHDTNEESKRTGLVCNDESLTKQEFKEDADINVIIQRFLKQGEGPPIVLPEHFQNLTGRTNYFEMHSRIAEANHAFYQLNPGIRAQFQNDPQIWADNVIEAIDEGDVKWLQEHGIDATLAPPAGKPTVTPPGDTPAPGPQEGPPGGPKT